MLRSSPPRMERSERRPTGPPGSPDIQPRRTEGVVGDDPAVGCVKGTGGRHHLVLVSAQRSRRNSDTAPVGASSQAGRSANQPIPKISAPCHKTTPPFVLGAEGWGTTRNGGATMV